MSSFPSVSLSSLFTMQSKVRNKIKTANLNSFVEKLIGSFNWQRIRSLVYIPWVAIKYYGKEKHFVWLFIVFWSRTYWRLLKFEKNHIDNCLHLKINETKAYLHFKPNIQKFSNGWKSNIQKKPIKKEKRKFLALMSHLTTYTDNNLSFRGELEKHRFILSKKI